MMMQHCVLAIQQVHSLAVKTDEFKKELTKKTKEVAKLLAPLNKAEARIEDLLDKAKATELALKTVEDRAEVVENVIKVAQTEAKEAKEKETEAQTELQTALATKEVEIKAADEKAYTKGAADVRDEYKKQVKAGFGSWHEVSTYDPANPPTALPVIHFDTKVTVTVAADEMGSKKAVADDLLADIPNIVTIQSSPLQSQPKPKPKRLKKAQTKATAPPITIEDKPDRVGDSTTDIEVGVTLSTALLLPKDLERNAEVSEYENFTLMLQHSVQVIQHAHSFAMQAFDIKKELVNKTKEATGLLKTVNKAEAKMKTLISQANAARKAQDEAKEKQELLRPLLSLLFLPFPPTPSQSKDEAESEEDAEDDKSKNTEAAGAKSPNLNEQFLDLTQDKGDEVSKEDALCGKIISEAPITKKSLDQTLEEIDVELAAEKAAEKSSQMSSENQTLPADDAE
ncbi:uncharacterized protein LOC114283465 [Camellia sinensis]|uniref:uncharacterized protein LOC114283465 n=1 Tax=Camellia sinensis TaxID=4442 RepID=UPI00103683A4|nr:uncharacterized protein LOC114283465 [Camellia sinensis]